MKCKREGQITILIGNLKNVITINQTQTSLPNKITSITAATAINTDKKVASTFSVNIISRSHKTAELNCLCQNRLFQIWYILVT